MKNVRMGIETEKFYLKNKPLRKGEGKAGFSWTPYNQVVILQNEHHISKETTWWTDNFVRII